MPTLSGKYNIKAVSNIIGVQPSTLRAWERRYQIIAPKRNQAGHRLYTEEHIQILKWLMEKSFFRYDDWTSSSVIRRESFAEYSSKKRYISIKKLF